ncbi:MAG: enoyl-CoA hydratase/isomerase family protein [Proteobacteria bacterium]|nr:enoyl-CoA hydratase/isomerase family protein [Pseudomonadota bacterium]
MTTEYQYIKWEREGNIGILKFNRPETMNALGPEINGDMADFLPRLAQDEDLRVMILTGEGRAFCAGGNLDVFMGRSKMHREMGGAMPLYNNDMVRHFLKLPFPIIAAVNGPAIGGGITLSLAADLRIASEQASFGAVFTRVGLSPEYGSSFLLSRTVGLTRASEMVLTARIVDAAEALSIGLVSHVVPGDQLMDLARKLAGQIASLSPVAVRMAKRTLRNGMSCTLDQAIDYEELAETHCFSSLDHEEAVKAFVEKRKPNFVGR